MTVSARTAAPAARSLQRRPLDEARLFFMVGWYSYRALFTWLTPIGYVMTKVLTPLFQIAVFALLAASQGLDPADRAIGNAVQVAAVNGIFGVMMMVDGERNLHTLVYVVGSPGHRLTLFTGRVLFHLLDGLLGVALGLAFGVVAFHVDLAHANLPWLLLAIVVTIVSVSGFGLALASFSLVSREMLLVANIAYWAMVALCGVNFPVDRLPGPLRLLALGLPLTHGLQGIRELIGGASIGSAGGWLAGEMVVGAAYCGAGFLLFVLIERLSRARATLDLD